MSDRIDTGFFQDLWSGLLTWSLNSGPKVVIIIVLFLIVMKIYAVAMNGIKRAITRRYEHKTTSQKEEFIRRANTLTAIIRQTGSVLLWVIFIVTLLSTFGVNIAPILAGAGIVGLAVGFGAQELVRDVISGFFILLEDHIREGDVATINGTSGLVEAIQLRTVELRDLSGVVHVFQNGKINSLSNMTKTWSATVFDIGVAYKEDVDKVIEVIKTTAEELLRDPQFEKKILEPLEVFGLDKFGDSAIVIKARFKTKTLEQWSVGREFNRRLKIAFDNQGIEIPFPHQTIYWGEEIKPLRVESHARS